MKNLKEINDQKELGSFLQKYSKNEKFELITDEVGALSVNEAQIIARVIVDVYNWTGEDRIVEYVMGCLPFSNEKGHHVIKARKQILVSDILSDVFSDINRWMFSKSRKMMKKIIENAKS